VASLIGVVLGVGVAIEVASVIYAERQREALDGLVGQLARIETRLAAVTTDNENLRQAMVVAGPQFAALRQRLDHLEVMATEHGGISQGLRAMAAQIADIEERLKTQQRATLDPAVLADVTRRLETLDRRLADSEAAAQPMVAELRRRIEPIEARVQTLGRNEASLAELGGRLRQLESRSAQGAATGALAVLVARLREAVRSGNPYQAEMNALRVLMMGNPSLAEPLGELAPHAARGVPTAAVLRAQLADLANQAVAAGDVDEDAGWWTRTWQRLRGLVIVRRVGVVPGPTPEAVLARAEAALRDDDLNGAVEELTALQGPPAQLLAPWLAAARDRLAIDEAVRDLDQRLLAVFGGS